MVKKGKRPRNKEGKNVERKKERKKIPPKQRNVCEKKVT
jgi:hypothetical protein